jgi:DNA mismatch repair protein MutL
MRDLTDELAELGEALALKERLEEPCGTLACHGSVRARRRQCNHGRPTYVELPLADIEKLFGRR